jgi:hypothetical protein
VRTKRTSGPKTHFPLSEVDVWGELTSGLGRENAAEMSRVQPLPLFVCAFLILLASAASYAGGYAIFAALARPLAGL